MGLAYGIRWVFEEIFKIKTMQDLAYEPLAKSYTAPVTSKSFCIPYICYLLTLVIPATLLINIQYSWPEFNRVLLTPSLQYRAYQLMCLDDAGDISYSSNFKNQDSNALNYATSISVSVDADKVYVNGDVFKSGLTACNIQLYFTAKITKAVSAIVQLPLNLNVNSENLYLSSATLMGTIIVDSNTPLPQSSILTIDQNEYSSTFPHTFHSNFLQISNRNISLFMAPSYKQMTNSQTSTDSFSFSGQFRILPKVYYQQASLIHKIRAFIPIFMFIALLLWKLAVSPLVDWMLLNRVYSTKLIHEKIKQE